VALTSLASLLVGIGLFGGTVFLSFATELSAGRAAGGDTPTHVDLTEASTRGSGGTLRHGAARPRPVLEPAPGETAAVKNEAGTAGCPGR
jgi:hypothetical protein